MGGDGLTCDDRAQSGTDIRVLVETQDRVSFGKGIGKLSAIALSQAAHSNHRALIVRKIKDGVDRILLRGLDKTAGIDDHSIGFVGFINKFPAIRG